MKYLISLSILLSTSLCLAQGYNRWLTCQNEKEEFHVLQSMDRDDKYIFLFKRPDSTDFGIMMDGEVASNYEDYIIEASYGGMKIYGEISTQDGQTTVKTWTLIGKIRTGPQNFSCIKTN
jgi:hypothetical protein